MVPLVGASVPNSMAGLPSRRKKSELLSADFGKGANMQIAAKQKRSGFKTAYWIPVLILLALAFGPALRAQDQAIAKKLQGFDAYMAKILKDWHAPGVGVDIVSGDKLVFAKGY